MIPTFGYVSPGIDDRTNSSSAHMAAGPYLANAVFGKRSRERTSMCLRTSKRVCATDSVSELDMRIKAPRPITRPEKQGPFQYEAVVARQLPVPFHRPACRRDRLSLRCR